MTFIHEGNANYVDKLVNFEKMVRQKHVFVTLLSFILLTYKVLRMRFTWNVKLFLLFSQRMIAKTVKIVRGCRSQPYGEWASWTCQTTKSRHAALAGAHACWSKWMMSGLCLWMTRVGYISVCCLQCLHLHRGAWQIGCFWKGLLLAYLHVSSN